MANLERIKQLVQTGRLKMWGVRPVSNNGFTVTETEGKELLALTAPWTPYVRFKVKPMNYPTDKRTSIFCPALFAT